MTRVDPAAAARLAPRSAGAVLAEQGSAGERALETQLRQTGATGWVRELQFDPARRWRFDFAWSDAMVAVEVEGATWSADRHNPWLRLRGRLPQVRRGGDPRMARPPDDDRHRRERRGRGARRPRAVGREPGEDRSMTALRHDDGRGLGPLRHRRPGELGHDLLDVCDRGVPVGTVSGLAVAARTGQLEAAA